MRYKLNLNDRAFNAIINKTKRVEIRANVNNDYSKFNKGDMIDFVNSTNDIITCKVLEVNHYETIEDLLTLEGTKYTCSSTDDFNEAIKSINSLNGYKDEIAKSGVYAIHIEYLYKLSDIWNEMYNMAKETLNDFILSDSMDAGGVAAIVLSKSGNIYKGVCIDTACSIGMCAERNAISSMITNGENEIDKVVCIGKKFNIMMPCGVCREFMMQMSPNSRKIEILKDLDTKEIVELGSLMPDWWN